MGSVRILGSLAALLAAGALIHAPASATQAREHTVSQFVIEQLFKSDAQRAGLADPLGQPPQPPLLLDIAAPPGTDSGLFEILSNVDYAVQLGEIGFLVRGDLSCFDREGVPPTALRVVGVNPSGFPAIDIRLSNDLTYDSQDKFLTLNNFDSASVPTAACFWRHTDAETGASSFTAFGKEPPVVEVDPNQDRVFDDRFESESEPSINPMTIEYIDLPDTAMLGDEFTYRIRLSNIGSTELTGIGFQELFVGNAREALALLRTVDGSISCQALAGSDCGALPKEIESPYFPGQFMQLPYLRADYLDGVTLAAGGSLEFTVNRRVIAGRDTDGQPIDATESLGEKISLTAVIVDLSSGENMPSYAVAEREIEIVARGSLHLSPDESYPVVSDSEGQTITVQLLDDQGQQLRLAGQEVTAEVISGDATLLDPTTAETNNTAETNDYGQVRFEVRSTVAGAVSVRFTASGLLDPTNNAAESEAELNFQPADAVDLEFVSTLPNSFIQGQTIDGLVVRAIDNWGNTAINIDDETVQIFLYQNDELDGSSLASQPLENGMVSFSGFALPVDKAGEGFSFAAIRGLSSGINGFSSEFSISSAASITLDGLGDNDNFGSNTLAVGFPSESVTTATTPSVPTAWQGLSVNELAAAVVDEESKILFLDTFFALKVSQGGISTPIDAASLGDLLDLDWSHFHLAHDGALALTVTIDSGFVELNYVRDKGNSGATRIDVTWIGTDGFEAGGLALADPAERDFKAEFYVHYDDNSGPAWAADGPDGSAPAATRFIKANTLIVRPFALGIAYGNSSDESVTLSFPNGMDAVLSLDGGDPSPYVVGTPVDTRGNYELLVTNNSNLGFRDGSTNRLVFTVD